jgi:V/A-type H+-transporting ATPase subunit C
MFAFMLDTAKKLDAGLKTSGVTRWVRHKIDAENLRNAVRLQRMNYDYAGAFPFFHKGGTIGPDTVAKLLGEPLETWSKSLSHTDIGAALDPAQDKADVQSTLSEISKALDDYLIRVLDKAKYSASAPENVILYLLRKEEEARNLRIVLVCVANGLNREFARRLLSSGR